MSGQAKAPPTSRVSRDQVEAATRESGGRPYRRTASGVSAWWRAATIGLVILLVLIAVLTFELRPLNTTKVETQVDWFHYQIASSPQAQANDSNFTLIPQLTYCAPDGALTTGVFSMVWLTLNGAPVRSVALWVVYPSGSGNSLIYGVNLYEGRNSSSGGTSFISAYPDPCGYDWLLQAASSQNVTVYAVATLTYNYTANVPG